MWRRLGALALIAAACRKDAPAPDCEHAGAARLVRHCKADGWSAKAIACAKTDSERCLSLLTPAQQQALRDDPEAQALTKQQPLELPERCERDPLAIVLAPESVRIGVAHGAACKRPRADLERELQSVRMRAEGCAVPVRFTATGDVLYQDLISAMDVAVKLGMSDVALDEDPAFTTIVDVCPVPAGKHAASATLPASDVLSPASVPVVIVTKQGIELAGKHLANADELESALPPHPADSRVVLQADVSTSTTLIDQIVLACRRAGYDNLLFAVKDK